MGLAQPKTDDGSTYADILGWPCRPFVAPFDVRLPKAGMTAHAIDTVVQPDISVVCDAEELNDDRGCLGAPEYWLVPPIDRRVTIDRLGERGYQKPLIFGVGEACAPAAFPDLGRREKPSRAGGGQGARRAGGKTYRVDRRGSERRATQSSGRAAGFSRRPLVIPVAEVFAGLPPIDEAIVG